MKTRLMQIERGIYETRDGRFRVVGLCLRWDGRDGSRINAWMVTDRVKKQRSVSMPTLDRVREYITSQEGPC